MEEESREGMLEYQEDQKGLHRLEHKILWRGPKNLSNNINFSHRINYYNTVDIINKISITIHYCTITGKMHIYIWGWKYVIGFEWCIQQIAQTQAYPYELKELILRVPGKPLKHGLQIETK